MVSPVGEARLTQRQKKEHAKSNQIPHIRTKIAHRMRLSAYLSNVEFVEPRRPAPELSTFSTNAKELASQGMRADKSRRVEMSSKML